MISIERRLSLGLALAILALMAALWGVSSTVLRHLTEQLVASRMAHDGESILVALTLAEGRVQLDDSRLGAIYGRPLSGHYFVILAAGARLQSRSLWDAELPAEPVAVGAVRLRHVRGPQGEPLLMWEGGFRKQGEEVTVAVAEDLGPLLRQLRTFDLAFAGVSLAALAALLLAQRFIVRSSLASLARVRRDLRDLEAGEAGALSEEVPPEVQPLVREINRLLASGAQRLARSRNSLGNLAHALKHPLALLQRTAERLRTEGHGAAPELEETVGRLGRLVDGELKRARFAGGGGPGQRFVPDEELGAMAALLRRIHHDKALVLECAAPPGRTFPLDRDDLLELIGNLLDNACKWCAGRVRCHVDDAREFRLTVEDDGPGFAPGQGEMLLERGARLDESMPGHGLGLSIVQDLVRLYGGSIRFGRSELGGLRVDVALPAGGGAA